MEHDTLLKVVNEYGLHARSSALLFRTIREAREKYNVGIELYDNGDRCDGVLQLIMLGKIRGDRLSLKLEGSDYKPALDYVLEGVSDIVVEDDGDYRASINQR